MIAFTPVYKAVHVHETLHVVYCAHTSQMYVPSGFWDCGGYGEESVVRFMALTAVVQRLAV